MKTFSWSDEKNSWLKDVRQISFEEIVLYIEMGFLLDILVHPNQEKYLGQKILVVQGEDYVFLVPFVEEKDKIFLKTIIPSRKATRRYMKGNSK